MTVPDPTDGLVRGVRAGVLTVPVVVMASLAHYAGGECFNLFGVAIAAGLLWPAAVAMLGSRRRLPAIAAWLVVAQAVTHQVLHWTCSDLGATSTPFTQPAAQGSALTMLGLHAVMVLVTAPVLVRADAGLWSARAVLGAMARFALPVLHVAVPTMRPVVVAPYVPELVGDLWKAPHPVRRGPPR